MRRLVHLSDLHLGRSPACAESAGRLVRALERLPDADVVVTGDLTHKGRRDELALFERLFAPIRDRTVVVPGNHDRLGDDVAPDLMPGRVDTITRPGLHLVRVDSTGPHNRAFLRAEGSVCREILRAVDDALDEAPRGATVAVLLHHHVLPLPEDSWVERAWARFAASATRELELGRELLEVVRGRCDLVLHGHRHRPSDLLLFEDESRALRICNAGSSTALGAARTFVTGGVPPAPTWLVAAFETVPRAPQTRAAWRLERSRRRSLTVAVQSRRRAVRRATVSACAVRARG